MKNKIIILSVHAKEMFPKNVKINKKNTNVLNEMKKRTYFWKIEIN